MARQLPKTDVVIVGGGATGLISAYELAHNGQKCVVLERGRMRHEVPDFQTPEEHDELKYAVRTSHALDVTRSTLTFRNHKDERALPMRRLGSFLPGEGLGGAMIHWIGHFWRPYQSSTSERIRSFSMP